MTKIIKIYYQNILVGKIHDPKNDMWYFYGKYEDEINKTAQDFKNSMKQQNLKYNIINFEGKYIQWSSDENEDLQHGLAIGIDAEDFFNFRLVYEDELIETLQKEEKYS